MFKNEADARAIIQQYCIEEAGMLVTPADIELIMSRLRPQFWIAPVSDASTAMGRTHFGGAPEMPKGATWPLRPIPSDAAARAGEFSKYKTQHWIASHIVRELPFEFIAQIDLAEAARHPALAQSLPDTGRLLFFWDGVVGLHIEGATACKVIWDETPAPDLEPVPIPPVFAELEKAYAIEQHAAALDNRRGILQALPDSVKLMKSAGMSDADMAQAENAIREQFAQPFVFDPDVKKPYVHPRRSMTLTPILHLPGTHTIEAGQDTALSTALNANPHLAECYRVLTSNDEGPFAKSGRYARRHRLLGLPDPEQDDPRYGAIDTALYPKGPWSPETIRDANVQASAWRLLLQVDLGDMDGSGTVYFIIRHADLANRDFSQVHAYYQTT
jgi:uncharacterized protein YwqG